MILVTGVTGVSGQLGRATLSTLQVRGADVLGGSRSGADRLIDFDRPETLDFSGADTLVLISAGVGEDDQIVARHEAAIAAAERDGVGHVIYTSINDEGENLPMAIAHRWTERRLHRSRVQWTVLRNGLYAELLGRLAAPVGGRIVAPLGTGRLAAVARADLAEVAATVALEPDAHRGETIDLVGERAIGGADIATALGMPYVPGSITELRERTAGMGLYPFQPAMLVGMNSAIARGLMSTPGGRLRELLGRAPQDPLPIATEWARAASS